jgi:uncharacterized protein (TIGR02646 family)
VRHVPKTAPIPKSLQNKTTEKARKSVIDAGAYNDKFDSRYKQADVKEALSNQYHHKCAFCEQKVEQFHVEHFRPKKGGYYWLAFSWDNLLLSCPTCNQHKDTNFACTLGQTSLQSGDVDSIHELARVYEKREGNYFIHPELEDAEPLLVFDKDGAIRSEDDRAHYTITTCKLDREYLREARQTILDEFEKNKTKCRYLFKLTKQDKYMIELHRLIQDFEKKANNPKTEFIAFRRYALRNWRTDISQAK